MVNTVAGFDTQTQSTTEDANLKQIAGFLQEHDEVEMILPVLIGLFVTSQFQLRGANALLVNLAVASVSRQVFKQLKNPSSTFSSPSATSESKAITKPSSQPNSQFLGEGVQIIHSVPGRIRLRIEQLGSDALFAKRLERLLNNDDSVISVRINRTAQSVVINYDAGDLSDFDLGLKLMNILNLARSENS